MSLQDQLTTLERQQLACELSGVTPEYLLKVRATADSLVVIIHTGEKFIYDLEAIAAALQRLGVSRPLWGAQLDASTPPSPSVGAAPRGRPGGEGQPPAATTASASETSPPAATVPAGSKRPAKPGKAK